MKPIKFRGRLIKTTLWFWLLGGPILFLTAYCNGSVGPDGRKEAVEMVQKDYNAHREAMVQQLQAYGIKNRQVLAAMRKIPRHLFIPATHRGLYDPYGDHPCPIGYNQTISQPYIVAYMTEKMKLQKNEKVLEIGTGSGYQAAVLAELGAKVYSIEIIPPLAQHARNVLKTEGFTSVEVLQGDGYDGWPEKAPFEAIIVTCAPEHIPQKLVEQLKEGGRMFLPLGAWNQRLVFLRKKKGKIIQEEDFAVRFVPMVHGQE